VDIAMRSIEERNALVTDNIELITFTIGKYFKQCMQYYEDMKYVATLALIRAAQRYDADRGIKFSTFAVNVIHNDICIYLASSIRHKKDFHDNCDYLHLINDDGKECGVVDRYQVCEDYTTAHVKEFLQTLKPEIRRVVVYTMLGYKQYEIAKKEGITTTGVQWRLRRAAKLCGERRDKKNQEDNRGIILTMLDEGMTPAEISQKLKIPRQRVYAVKFFYGKKEAV
jgi:RNA polymerase sigma factor (sigma-70 family)